MKALMIKPTIPLTPRALALLALLLLLGFLGNCWSLPLFFGVDFILGSIAVLIVVYWFGVGLGMLAAMIAGSYTYFLWGHPYALIIFTLEALFVGLSLHKGRRSLLLLDGLFWLVIGMPAVWCFYGLAMHMDAVSTHLVMLKQGINGIFNALLASLAISLLPLRKILDSGNGRQTISLRDTLFNLLVALILGPALFIMILNSRGEMREMQDVTLGQMQRGGADISSLLGIWYQQNLEAVTELAALAAKNPLKPSPDLQHDTELIHKTSHNFQALCVANAQGTSIAFSPAVNKNGQSTIGLNYADRPYFQELQATRQPVLSEVIVGRTATFTPVVTLSVPILRGDQFSGYALGAMDLARIQEILEPYGKLRDLSITLIDSLGRVIASTVPDRQPMMPWRRLEVTTLKLIKDSVYHWLPDDKNLPMMTRWKNSFYVQETAIAKMGWKLILETPVAPLQKRLYTIYVYNLGLMAAMAALALLIAAFFSRWLVRPLAGLAQVTSNLSEKLLAHQDIPWPESSAAEIYSLVANFQTMARTLEGNIQELQARGIQLAEVNQGLKMEIAERGRVEEALRKSEAQYRLLADNARDVIWNMNLNQQVTYASPAVYQLTGFTPEEFLTLGLDQILTPASLKVAQENLARMQEIELREKPPLPPSVALEIEHRRKDGATIWTEVHATLLRGSQGKTAGFMGVSRDISDRRKVWQALEAAYAQLQILVQEADKRNSTMALLNNMSEMLQTCQTSEEAFSTISHFVPKFFPTDAGALYLLRNSKNLLSSVTTWGSSPPLEELFPPDDCWAVRSGRVHRVDDPASAVLCNHIPVTDLLASGYLCVPLVAQGDSLGILHIRFLSCTTTGRETGALEAKQRLAVAIAENLALSLANLKLRETLQNQAIRDPLTGLYNRRYLEETMDRELHRSRRLKAPLGVVMMDLDHFKDFNDSFGHGAGDAMLSALAHVITAGIRTEDIACRYGGEEFLLVMPGASLETTRERAENVRQAVQALQVKYHDRLLKSTTISLGVAIFPDHGLTAEEVIAAADAALYHAKQAGRDRVETASLNSPAAAAS
jgi:diguanylate cyclase (GGDEF)-like protein/PAS domain S-box-containing protein